MPASSDDDEAPWLSLDQLRDGVALVELLSTLPPAIDAQLKRDAGTNSFEYHILVVLAEAPDRTLILSALAALSQRSLSRLSHAITTLERPGWVERRSCTVRGGRRAEAWLTDAGLAKLEETVPGHVREVRRLVVDILTPVSSPRSPMPRGRSTRHCQRLRARAGKPRTVDRRNELRQTGLLNCRHPWWVHFVRSAELSMSLLPSGRRGGCGGARCRLNRRRRRSWCRSA